jgi:hypothetical protein
VVAVIGSVIELKEVVSSYIEKSKRDSDGKEKVPISV